MSIGGVLVSLSVAVEPVVCDAWPVRRQTYGYLPGRRASPPFGRYQIVLLGDRGTWVLTTCPELLPGGSLAGSRTWDLGVGKSPLCLSCRVISQILVAPYCQQVGKFPICGEVKETCVVNFGLSDSQTNGLRLCCVPFRSETRISQLVFPSRKSGCSLNSRISHLEIRLPTSMEQYFVLGNS